VEHLSVVSFVLNVVKIVSKKYDDVFPGRIPPPAAVISCRNPFNYKPYSYGLDLVLLKHPLSHLPSSAGC